jgi:flagella basal body P-ring formation protein FlgA
MLRTILAAGFILSSLAAIPAAAETSASEPALKAEVAVEREVVRIGDLVENAGEAADIAIFRAPDLGQTGAVATGRVLDALRVHGLGRIETHGLKQVMVTRNAREISPKAIEAQIIAAVADSYQLGTSNLTVTFDRGAQPLLVDVSAPDPRVSRVSYDRVSGRYDITFDLSERRAETGARQPQQVRFTGTIAETAEVAIPVRPIGRGDVIRAEDIVIERQPKANLRPGTIAVLEHVVGMAARRPLRSGQALTAADVMRPEVVIKNEAVTITYEAPGMMLSVRGKALESGAEGDLVSVFNAQTKRTLQGVVSGPGRIAIVTTFAQQTAPTTTGSIAAGNPTSRSE